jgi:hypothetical protein
MLKVRRKDSGRKREFSTGSKLPREVGPGRGFGTGALDIVTSGSLPLDPGLSWQTSGAVCHKRLSHTRSSTRISDPRQVLDHTRLRIDSPALHVPVRERRGLLILMPSTATRIDGPGRSRSAPRLERRRRAVSLVQIGGPHPPPKSSNLTFGARECGPCVGRRYPAGFGF